MGKNSKSKKVITRSESGTCNVCSAPCSSCLHINRALTTVKAEESSGETCQANIGSQYSVADPPVKISACDIGLQTASETSNASLNCDSYYGESGSKAGLKKCDVSRASDVSDMPLTKSSGGTIERLCDKRASKSNYEERKGTTGREDSTSCVTGGSEANRTADSNNKSVKLQHSQDELSSPNKKLIENTCLEKKNGNVRSLKLPNMLSYPDVQDLKEDLASKGHLSLSFPKGSTSDLRPGEEKNDHSKMESETQKNTVTENQPNTGDNSLLHSNENEQVESGELAGVQESKMESQPMIDTDESDVLEHDVKVCDICGDAGREDLLAVCSRCSDGAEHTYCMRKMMDKVPEGDWLCEECKALDEIKLKDAVVPMDVGDKYQSSEVDSVEDTDLILNTNRKDLDVKPTKPKRNILDKRNIDDRTAEDIEAPPVAKKRALGLTVESLKASRRVESLSRDSSFKKLSKGTLSKSSSFSTNPKSKVDFFGEVPQKHKVARESACIGKEGASKSIGRSTSFEPSSLSRLSHSESKVKMLSPKFSHAQDLKGSRQAKTKNILDRKSSFRPERLLASTIISSSTVSTPNGDKNLTPTDRFVSNNGEPKGVPSDSKTSTLSKSTSYTARKGEMKIGSVYDQRPKEAGIKDDLPSSNYAAEKLLTNSRGGLSPRFQNMDNPGERIKESSVGLSRTKIDSPRKIVYDASATRSSADVIKGNKLKAAIEAAIRKRPEICRKNKPADQSDEVSMPSTNLNCETRPEDHLSNSSKRRNMSSAYESHEGPATSNNGDQSSLPLVVASLKSGGSCSIVHSDMSNQPSATMSESLKMSVFPEHEYVWQGGFDIRKIGKLTELRDGLQAHLSTCASPKVFEVVNKFPTNLLLNEVPRSSTWPIQFQETGVKEDNIALYFFSKDLESYERSYKVLLETMMRRDLALKGSFDGVDLLIFPSNHLPQSAQRWNMLYFFWGVFRRKKTNCVHNMSDLDACNASHESECPATRKLPGNSNGEFWKGDSEKQDVKGEDKRIIELTVPETNGTSITLEKKADPKANTEPEVAKAQCSIQNSKKKPSNPQQNLSSNRVLVRERLSDDLVSLQRTVKEEEESTDAISVRERNVMVDQAMEPSKMQSSHGKRQHEDLIRKAAVDASVSSSLASTTFSAQGESANKKQKTDSAGIESAGNNMFPEMAPNIGHALEGEVKEPKRGFALDLNETQDYTPDSPSPVAKQDTGGLFDLNVAQDYPPNKDEEVGGSSLLSLSLSFPFSDKEPEVKPTAKMEPVLPMRPNTRSSLLFFDGSSKK